MCDITSMKKYSTLTFILLSILLIGVAYMGIVNSEFVLDDVPGIANNPTIGNASLIFANPALFSRPLELYLSYSIAGLQPWAYHILNILFHFGTVVALFFILRKLANEMVAWVASLMFAVHPLLVESVTWISAVTYPQYAFFLMWSLVGYLYAGKKRIWYVLSWIAYIFAMFASEKAVVFPVILIVLEFSYFSLRKNWRRIVPYALISAAIGAMLLTNFGGRVSAFQNDYLVKPVWINPLATIPTSLFWYLRLIFFPDKLSIYHPELALSPAMFAIQLGVTGLFVAALVGAFFKNKQVFFWLFWFFVTLTPTFLPMRLAWVVAERYVYLGTIGILVVVAMALVRIMRTKKYKLLGYVLVILIIWGLFLRTFYRNQDWQDTDSLWIATGKTAPEYHVTHNNLGDMYGRWGDPQRAIQEFLLATKIKPDYAEGYHNAGNTYLQLGDLQNAKKYFDLAVKYNPRIWQTHQDLAIIYFNGKKYKEALHELELAIKLSPQDAALYENLAITYEAMGDTAKAAYVRQHAPGMQ